MNFVNIDFLVFADFGDWGQLLGAALFAIITIVASAKGAKKKKEEMEKRKQALQQNHTPPRAVPQNQQKFWGVKLDPVRNEPDYSDEEYIEYDEDDEDDYDPLEPRPKPVQRNFTHKIKEPDDIPVKHLGNLENKHFKSNIEQDSFKSDIEMQQFISDLDSMGELSDSANLISDDDYDDDDDDLNIKINVAKGSPEALVHAIVLGELFGPPMCMREPYTPQDDEEAFKKSTLF